MKSTSSDDGREGIYAFRVAAFLQATIGVCMTALGGLGTWEIRKLPMHRVDFETVWFVLYLVVGLAAMATAVPLVTRVRWAWLASVVLVSTHPLMPLVHIVFVYKGPSGSLHGAECSILLLLAALPISAVLALLLWRVRSDTR